MCLLSLASKDGGEFLGGSSLHSRFVLVDSFMQNARIMLSSTLISNISGASFLINAVHGASLHLQNVKIEESATSMALLQIQYRSQLHAEGLVLKNNNARVSIVVTEDSQALITHSQFQQDVAFGIPISILVMLSSQVTVQQSCLPILLPASTTSKASQVKETTPVIVVDNTSFVQNDEKTIRTTTSTTSSRSSTTTTTTTASSTMAMLSVESPPSFSCEGSIFFLDEPGDCLDEGHCAGRCQSMAISDHCPLTEGDDQWASALQSSASTTKKATINSIIVAFLFVRASTSLAAQFL